MAPSKTLADQTHDAASHTKIFEPFSQWFTQIDFSDMASVGTGTATVTSFTGIPMGSWLTGATSGSIGGARRYFWNTVVGRQGVYQVRTLQFAAAFGNNTNQRAYVYVTNENFGPAAEPTNTVRHLGVRVANGVWYFSTADGTTEQTTDISAFITVGRVHIFKVVYDGTTATLYIDGVLRATHVTNVPGTVADQHTFFNVVLVNSAAEAKGMEFGHARIQWDA